MTVDERLAKLEGELTHSNRRNRHLLTALILCLAIAVVAWIMNPKALVAQNAANAPKEVRANSFILEDEKGRPRSVLTMFEGRPRLMLGDENGKARIVLGVGDNDPALKLCDENGKTRAMLDLAKGAGKLMFWDEKGNRVVAIDALGGESSLLLRSEKRKARAVLAVGDHGPGLVLGDEKRGAIVGIVLGEDGSSSLGFSDVNGTTRAVLGLNKEGSFLILAEETGKTRWQAP